MPNIRDVLAGKGQRVHHVDPNASVLEALKIMAQHNVGALVVLDDGKLVGIVSERDYARKIVLKGRTSPATPVKDIMSTHVACATLEQSVEVCLALMTAKAVRHLPILEHKRLVGIVSIGDLVKSVIADQKFTIEQLEHYMHGGR